MVSQAFKYFFLFTHLAVFALNLVHAQVSQSGRFISIDCGLAANSSYSEATTGINYISDASFIETGEPKLVLPEYKDSYQQPYGSLRSFPQGKRNCYKITVTGGTKYLLRASFFYGNYDGENKLPEFALHLGPNFWTSVSFIDAATNINKELIHYVPVLQNYLHVCLVDIGAGVPFISVLELRPLLNGSYQTEMGALELVSRYDTGLISNKNGYRYPVDVHDRFWYYYNINNDWKQLNTSFSIDSNNLYQPPFEVMRTAATPTGESDSLDFSFAPYDATPDSKYYIYMHFAEVENLKPNQSRQFNIMVNGELFYGPLTPSYLNINTIYSKRAQSLGNNQISILKTINSTLPPILNAYEIYTVKELTEFETDREDFDAITKVKSTFKIKKNWQGDPCAPQDYSWEGLKCSNDKPPRITSLDLSSSGLTGDIVSSISDLALLKTLDLSNNNLTGPIPDFFSQLSNLSVLILDNNNLTGSVPREIIKRWSTGLLSLSLCDNPNISENIYCNGNESKKKENKESNYLIPIVVSIAAVTLIFLVVVTIWWSCNRKKQQGNVKDAKAINKYGSLLPTKRKFTYSEIVKITNNFERTLGKGGFGTVFHGSIDKTQVAIKMLSPSSVQGLVHFQAEVDLLMRVHHKNLTSLVGYSTDENKVALVYEYMANGNLQENLSDNSSHILSWEERLRIAADAAQGLEYLHCGIKPPIIHRDVKSTNILLNDNFHAKLSDFGLSRILPTIDGSTQISTVVAGTPGYLDPEYCQSNRLNEKSDVYSFGIVLLEIITGRPVISGTLPAVINISKWVGFMLANGDIYGIVDPRLERNFNPNSVWNAVEIAMTCVSPNGIKRPTMSHVLVVLKECLQTELARTNQSHANGFGNSIEMMPEHSIAMMNPSVR